VHNLKQSNLTSLLFVEDLLYPLQTKYLWGVERNLPVRLSIFLVSVALPKQMKRYWWNFKQL